MKFDRSLLTFNPSNHGHYYDGRRCLGVTTALSAISKGDGLVQWAVNCALEYARANVPGPADYPILGTPEQFQEDLEIVYTGAKYAWKEKRDEAASIGTQAHNWIESYLKGEDPPWPVNPQVCRTCEAAVEWIKSVKWVTKKIEHQIYIPELGVAGICDWFAEINGVLAVPDWKTSKELRSSYAYQTAAYLKALENEFDVIIPDRWLIRIDKETGSVEPRLLPREDLEKDYQAFESSVHIYRREAELKRLWQNTKSGQ